MNGNIGAIYTKRMEFDPRALGARSILANPTDPSINDKLNNRLQRNEFMPFAPVILDNRAEEIFDVSTLNSYAMSIYDNYMCCETGVAKPNSLCCAR